MEHKFTRGPWAVSKVKARRVTILEVEANARLISAASDFIATAPRAVEILRIAAKVIREYAPDALHNYDGTTCDGYCIADDCETEADMLSLAIARAIGEATPSPLGSGGEG